MSLYSKILSLSPGIEKEDALSFLERASSLFLSSLPEKTASKFFKQFEVDNTGIECGNRYSFVIRGNYQCRKIRLDLANLAKDENSVYGVDKYDPVYYFKDGNLFVFPEPTEKEKAFVSKFPSISIDKDNPPETIPNIPNEAEPIIIYYASFFSNLKKAQQDRIEASGLTNNIDSLMNDFNDSLPNKIEEVSFEFSIQAPEKPDIQNLVSEIDTEIDLPSFDLEFSTDEIPKYEPTTAIEPNVDLSESENALQNAKYFIGSVGDGSTQEIPEGAYWLDDEDPEMVSSSVQLAAQEVNRANGYSNSQLQALKAYEQSINNRFAEFKASISAYSADIDAKVTKLKSNIEKFSAELNYVMSKADIELKKEYQKVKTDLDVYMAELNAFKTIVSSEIQEYQLEIQQKIQIFGSNLNKASSILQSINSISTKFQLLSTSYQFSISEAERMYKIYIQEFKNYIGADDANGRLIPDSRKR